MRPRAVCALALAAATLAVAGCADDDRPPIETAANGRIAPDAYETEVRAVAAAMRDYTDARDGAEDGLRAAAPRLAETQKAFAAAVETAAALSPPTEYADTHEGLVGAWRGLARAMDEEVAAARAGDADAFAAADRRVVRAAQRVERSAARIAG